MAPFPITTFMTSHRQGNVSPLDNALKGREGRGVSKEQERCQGSVHTSPTEGQAKERTGSSRGMSQVLAALEFIGFLSVGGGGHTDVHHVVSRRLVMGRPVCNLLLGHNAINLCKDVLEGFLYIC